MRCAVAGARRGRRCGRSQLSGAEPLLVDRIDAEYLRYFTATGRPTGEWAAANNRLRAADEEVARCAAAVAEVDEAVRTHAALTAELAGCSPSEPTPPRDCRQRGPRPKRSPR